MSKLVSILMPTRNSFEFLRRALQSIKSTASDFTQIEILLRVDSDDVERIQILPQLKTEFDACGIVGERGNGYLNMGTFIDDLVGIASGKWCWLFDDDSWVQGNSWQRQIADMPCDGANGPALNAEFYKLGESIYPNGPKGGPVGLIVPTDFCRALKHRNPVDSQWLDVLLQKNWTIHQLKGITYGHDGRPR